MRLKNIHFTQKCIQRNFDAHFTLLCVKMDIFLRPKKIRRFLDATIFFVNFFITFFCDICAHFSVSSLIAVSEQ